MKIYSRWSAREKKREEKTLYGKKIGTKKIHIDLQRNYKIKYVIFKYLYLRDCEQKQKTRARKKNPYVIIGVCVFVFKSWIKTIRLQYHFKYPFVCVCVC